MSGLAEVDDRDNQRPGDSSPGWSSFHSPSVHSRCSQHSQHTGCLTPFRPSASSSHSRPECGCQPTTSFYISSHSHHFHFSRHFHRSEFHHLLLSRASKLPARADSRLLKYFPGSFDPDFSLVHTSWCSLPPKLLLVSRYYADVPSSSVYGSCLVVDLWSTTGHAHRLPPASLSCWFWRNWESHPHCVTFVAWEPNFHGFGFDGGAGSPSPSFYWTDVPWLPYLLIDWLFDWEVDTSLEQLAGQILCSSVRVMWLDIVCRLTVFLFVVILFVFATGQQVTVVIVVSRPRPIPLLV